MDKHCRTVGTLGTLGMLGIMLLVLSYGLVLFRWGIIISSGVFQLAAYHGVCLSYCSIH
jgi:hypothetical protein